MGEAKPVVGSLVPVSGSFKTNRHFIAVSVASPAGRQSPRTRRRSSNSCLSISPRAYRSLRMSSGVRPGGIWWGGDALPRPAKPAYDNDGDRNHHDENKNHEQRTEDHAVTPSGPIHHHVSAISVSVGLRGLLSQSASRLKAYRRNRGPGRRAPKSLHIHAPPSAREAIAGQSNDGGFDRHQPRKPSTPGQVLRSPRAVLPPRPAAAVCPSTWRGRIPLRLRSGKPHCAVSRSRSWTSAGR